MRAASASVCSALAQLSVSQGIIEEGDEDEDSDDYEPAETFNHLDVPAALSHFSYSVSRRAGSFCATSRASGTPPTASRSRTPCCTRSRSGGTVRPIRARRAWNRFFATPCAAARDNRSRPIMGFRVRRRNFTTR